MEQPTPFLNLFFHGLVFFLVAAVFIGAVLIWIRQRQKGIKTEEYWKMLVFGIFFYAVSEFSDLFTPGLKASLGMHNYFTEFALLVGLAFIFIAVRRLIVADRQK